MNKFKIGFKKTETTGKETEKPSADNQNDDWKLTKFDKLKEKQMENEKSLGFGKEEIISNKDGRNWNQRENQNRQLDQKGWNQKTNFTPNYHHERDQNKNEGGHRETGGAKDGTNTRTQNFQSDRFVRNDKHGQNVEFKQKETFETPHNERYTRDEKQGVKREWNNKDSGENIQSERFTKIEKPDDEAKFREKEHGDSYHQERFVRDRKPSDKTEWKDKSTGNSYQNHQYSGEQKSNLASDRNQEKIQKKDSDSYHTSSRKGSEFEQNDRSDNARKISQNTNEDDGKQQGDRTTKPYQKNQNYNNNKYNNQYVKKNQSERFVNNTSSEYQPATSTTESTKIDERPKNEAWRKTDNFQNDDKSQTQKDEHKRYDNQQTYKRNDNQGYQRTNNNFRQQNNDKFAKKDYQTQEPEIEVYVKKEKPKIEPVTRVPQKTAQHDYGNNIFRVFAENRK